jgi:hypothetical protein
MSQGPPHCLWIFPRGMQRPGLTLSTLEVKSVQTLLHGAPLKQKWFFISVVIFTFFT